MKLNAIQAAILAGACSFAAGGAHAAATSWDPSWAFSGFGTLGYVQTNTDQGLFAGPGQSGGASKEGTLGVDSKIGAQVNAKANNVFSGTVQVISQRNGNGNFKPAVEWAFLKAQATPELSVRVGRIGLPIFAVSDFRSIGYANLALRTPLDVYGQVGFSHFDGADATWQQTVGSATLTGQLLGGIINGVSTGVPVNIKKTIGLNLSAEFDNGITVRVGRVQGKISLQKSSLDALVTALDSYGYTAVGDELYSHDKDASFTGIGLSYDHENWVGSFEFTKRKTSSFVSSTTGWAATGGYRLGKFTPYVVVSQLKRNSSNVDNTIPTSVLSATVDAALATQDLSQKTNSLGVRWDAWKNIDVKAQYDRIKPTTVGLFTKAQAGLAGSTVNVYSVALDFVF
jgi:hypothetical protein